MFGDPRFKKSFWISFVVTYIAGLASMLAYGAYVNRVEQEQARTRELLAEADRRMAQMGYIPPSEPVDYDGLW